MMKTRTAVWGMACAALGVALAICPNALARKPGVSAAQTKMASAPTIASVLDMQLRIVESQFVPAAEAMPADKYSFKPSDDFKGGEFGNVRTFGEQVKHVAMANHVFFSAILGENYDPKTADAVKTKAQIIAYLKESFAMGHRAIATITAENATAPLAHPAEGFLSTPLAAANAGAWHTMDHYGQIVEYLRMNGIIPPASRPRSSGGRG